MKEIIIYKNDSEYSSFPSIIITKKNEILVAFRVAGKFSVKSAKRDLVTHHDYDSTIKTISSNDGGFTWDRSTIKNIYDFDKNLGVNDPGLTLLSNDELLLRVCVLYVVPANKRSTLIGSIISHREEHNLIASIRGNLIFKSFDSGINWETLCFVEDSKIRPFCSRESIIELKDKTLLLSGYRGAPYMSDSSILLRSYDGGRNWGDESSILLDPNNFLGQHYATNYNETSILSLGEGHIIALARSDSTFYNDKKKYIPVGGVGELTFTESYDNGLSWYPPTPTGIFGQPAHLLLLNDGRILTTYGYRKKPYGIRAKISKNKGKSWSKEIIIKDDGLSWDLGYPSSIETNSKEILTVYYTHDSNGVRYIVGKHWRLND